MSSLVEEKAEAEVVVGSIDVPMKLWDELSITDGPTDRPSYSDAWMQLKR